MRTLVTCFLLLPSLIRSEAASPAAAPAIKLSVPSSAVAALKPSSTFGNVAAPQATASPPLLLSEPNLELREIAAAVPAAAIVPVQVPPVTNVYVQTVLPNGQTTQVLVVYSQTYASIPNQGPTPVAGQIGMGTLTGSIGVVKTAVSGADSKARRGWVVVMLSTVAAALLF
ncbi:MAG: hypothetical protein M1830_004772 [Pleopsidium flavum]|nr:MAG: hypothetical protein M1830_004772 [Pleopsidium flavum]